MGLKKRNKVSAEFSMSSLTDIIFLLLIFFMLTSSLVSPNSLNLKLPGRSKPSLNSSNPPEIVISQYGAYFFNGSKVSSSNIRSRVSDMAKNKGSKPLDMVVSPDPRVANEHVVTILDILNTYKVNAILANSK